MITLLSLGRGIGLTGLADAVPATKYLKGDATVRAVETNEQLTLDFDDFDLGQDDGRADSSGDLLTWFLLYHANEEGFRVELSLPDAIVDGRIISWAERIILPVFPRLDNSLADSVTPGGGDVGEDVIVEVTRR